MDKGFFNISEAYEAMNIADATAVATELYGYTVAAAEEYTKAFAKYGAKMWIGDAARVPSDAKTRLYRISFIVEAFMRKDKHASGMVKWEFDTAIRSPLTVCDSYPNMTKADHENLDRDVDAIQKKYTRLVNALRRKVL